MEILKLAIYKEFLGRFQKKIKNLRKNKLRGNKKKIIHKNL